MPQLASSLKWPVDPNSLINPDFHANGNPQILWSWMRNNVPIYWHEPSHLPGFWSVTRYEDIQAVYSNPKVFSSARGVLLRPAKYGDDPGGGLTLALTDPPRHKQLRSIMAGWFSMSYARSLEETIRAKICELLSQAIDQERCNFSNDITAKLTLFVTCHILGIPPTHHDDVFNWAHESFEEGKPLATHQDFMLYFCELMEQKKQNATHDLASAIVHGFIDDIPLAEKEIILNFENLIGATENAGLSMASGILAFLEHPESWEILEKNRDLITPATEEILRWASSASHSMRTVTEPTTINGVTFKEGERVALWLPSANRDETIFLDPFKFDITRVPNRHIALGYGEHFCIGNALARIQMRLLLNQLLDLEYKLALEDTPMRLHSIHVNGPEVLPIRFIKK